MDDGHYAGHRHLYHGIFLLEGASYASKFRTRLLRGQRFGMSRTEWFTTMAWAGIFLALFILNRYQRNREPSWIGWVAWEAEAGLEDSTIWREPPPYRRQNPRSWKSYARDSMRTVSVPAFVRSDTVSAKWLAGYWPQWKADRFITQRARWGGMDSAIAAKEDWLDTQIGRAHV